MQAGYGGPFPHEGSAPPSYDLAPPSSAVAPASYDRASPPSAVAPPSYGASSAPAAVAPPSYGTPSASAPGAGAPPSYGASSPPAAPPSYGGPASAPPHLGYGAPRSNEAASTSRRPGPATDYGIPSLGYGEPSSEVAAAPVEYQRMEVDYDIPTPGYGGPQADYNNPGDYGVQTPNYQRPSAPSAPTRPTYALTQSRTGQTGSGFAAPPPRVEPSSYDLNSAVAPVAQAPYGAPAARASGDLAGPRVAVSDPSEGTIWWGIGLFGAVMLLVLVGALAGSRLAFILAFALYMGVSLFSWIAVSVAAFRNDGVVHGILASICVYNLYYAAVGPVSRTIKWIYWTHQLGGAAAYFVVIGLLANMFSGDCRTLRPHLQAHQAAIARLELRVDGVSNAENMASSLRDVAREIRVVNQQLGTVSFDSELFETGAVDYYKFMLTMPGEMDETASAFSLGSPTLMRQRTEELQRLIAKFEGLRANFGQICNPTNIDG